MAIIDVKDQGATPANPPAGYLRLYPQGTAWKYVDENGTVRTLSTGITPEEVQDIVGSFFVDSANLEVNYDDLGNQVSVDIKASLLSTINSALQAGDNVSQLTNDAGYQNAAQVETEAQAEAQAAVTAHEGASDPHPQYTTAAEAANAAPVQSVNGETGAVTDVAKTDENNVFTQWQRINTTGQAALDIDSDASSAGINLRADNNLWGIYAANSPNELYIGTNNGPGTAEEFIISTTEIDAKSKPIKNVTNPTQAQDAATKGYVDSLATQVASGLLRFINDNSNDGTVSTTSGTFQTRVSTNHSAVQGRRYKLEWYGEVQSTSTSGRTEIQIIYDGVERALVSYEAEDPNDWVPLTGFCYLIANSNASENLDLNWRRANTAGTSSLRRARVSITEVMS